MSNGGAQHKIIGPYYDGTNGQLYQNIWIKAYIAGATSVAKTFWTQEDKAAGNVTELQGGADGTVDAFFDGDYAIEVLASDKSTVIQTYLTKKITADTATMWEGNFGTVTPSVVAAAKGHLFLKMDGSDNILALQASNGAAFTDLIKLTASGESVLDNLATAIMPVANIKHPDYGAIGDGSTDDTTAIQAAIDAIEAEGGGIVWVPEGTFKTTIKLVIDNDNVTLQGCNQGAAIIKTNHATLDILELGDGATSRSNIIVRDILFDSSVTRSGGFAIDLNKITNSHIQNVRLDNQFIGIGTSATNSAIRIRDVDMQDTVEVTGVGIQLSHGNDYFIDVLTMDNVSTAQPLAGVRLVDVSSVFMSNSHILRSGHGVFIDPQAGESVSSIFINNCSTSHGNIGNATGVGNGININGATATSTITGISLSGCLSNNNIDQGINISGNASATIDSVSINNCKSFENTEHGIFVDVAINTEIEGCTISGNDAGDTDTFNGINMAAGVTLFKIVGNTIGQVAGRSNTQNIGINVASGASDDYIIFGNELLNNKNTNINDEGTGTNKIVENNLDGTTSTGEITEVSTVSTVGAALETLWSKTLAADTAYMITASIVAVYDTASPGVSAVGATLNVTVDDGLLRNSVQTYYYEAAAGFDVVADLSGGDVRIRVLGVSGSNHDWKASVKILTVAT